MFKMVTGDSHVNQIEMLVVLLRCLNLGCLLLLRVVLPSRSCLGLPPRWRKMDSIFIFLLFFRANKKLKPHPDLLGVKFKISDKHPACFTWKPPPPPPPWVLCTREP